MPLSSELRAYLRDQKGAVIVVPRAVVNHLTEVEALLREIGASTVLFTGDVVVGYEQRGDWQRRIAKVLEES